MVTRWILVTGVCAILVSGSVSAENWVAISRHERYEIDITSVIPHGVWTQYATRWTTPRNLEHKKGFPPVHSIAMLELFDCVRKKSARASEKRYSGENWTGDVVASVSTEDAMLEWREFFHGADLIELMKWVCPPDRPAPLKWLGN
jgi:hypothetical protein